MPFPAEPPLLGAPAVSWIVVLWSAMVGITLTMAATHTLIWFRDRRAWAQLTFSLAALATIAVGAYDFAMLRAETPAEYGALLRWVHLPGFLAITCIVLFVHFYLGTGRVWLGAVVVGFRGLSLVLNFTTGVNLNLRAIHSLQKMWLLGEPVSLIREATPNPWMIVGQIAHFLWLIYVLDATRTLWRRGGENDRRRAWLIGVTMTLVILGAGWLPAISFWGVFRMPLLLSVPFVGVVMVLGYELSEDVVRAALLTRRLQSSEAALRESELRMDLAAQAAEFSIWTWDVRRDEVWMTAKGREISGFTAGERINFRRLFANVHPEDRRMVDEEVAQLLANGRKFEREFRRVLPNGETRWMSGRGTVERDATGRAVRIRGASLNITAQRAAEEEMEKQRRDAAHLSRVAMLGELSGSLAHELNQPLTSILSNAQAAQRMMAGRAVDLTEVGAILDDIVTADKHASEVIGRVRALLKNDEVQKVAVDLNEIVAETLRLMESDFRRQAVEVRTELAPALPLALGDPVQLQQVVLNLAINAGDSMTGHPTLPRRLIIRTETPDATTLRVSVVDAGHGIPPELLAKVFEPFVTTKTLGLGLGLAVCRTIIAAHGGSIAASNNAEAGATFSFALPVKGASA
ncbi:MAG: ATP-binding protein [Chthoniobacteraceae bacterium]